MPQILREKKTGRRFVRTPDGELVPLALYRSGTGAAPTEAVETRPGLSRFAIQGGPQGAANLAGLADLLTQAVRPGRAFDASRAALGLPATPESNPTRFADATRRALQGSLDRAGFPYVEPANALERGTQAATAGVVETLPTLALPGGLASKAGALLNLGSGAASEVAATEARAAGASPGVQLGAALLAGASPSTIRGIVRGAASAKNLVAPSPATRTAIAGELATTGLRGEIPEAALAEAQQMIDDAMAKPLFESTTEMALGDRFPGITGLAQRVAANPKAGPAFRQRVHELELRNAAAARAYTQAHYTEGSFPPVVQAYERELTRMQRIVEKAYLRAGEIHGIPDDSLRAAAARVRLATEPIATSLQPKEILQKIAFVRKRGEGINLSELRQLDSLVSKTWYNKGVPLSGDEQRFLAMIDGAIEKTYDEAAAAGGASNVNALRRAIKLRKLQGTRFNPSDPLFHLFKGNLQALDLDGAFTSILNRAEPPKGLSGRTKAPGPVESLRVAKTWLANDPQAWAGVQTMVDRQVFGPNFRNLYDAEGKLSRAGARQVRENLRRLRPVLEVARGPGATDAALDFVDDLERNAGGRINLQQSAPLPTEDKLVAQLGHAAGTLAWNRPRGLMQLAVYALGRLPKTAEESDQILAGLLYDKPLGRGALRPTSPAQAQAWQTRMQKWMARTQTAARQGPRAAAGIAPPEETE